MGAKILGPGVATVPADGKAGRRVVGTTAEGELVVAYLSTAPVVSPQAEADAGCGENGLPALVVVQEVVTGPMDGGIAALKMMQTGG